MNFTSLLSDSNFNIQAFTPEAEGRLRGVRGNTLLAELPLAGIGDICEIETIQRQSLLAEVISFQEEQVLLAPFDEPIGVTPGCVVRRKGNCYKVHLPDPPLGLVIDALGRPLNSSIFPSSKKLQLAIRNNPPGPLERTPINDQLTTGIKIVDGLCPIGYGQRMAISASAGVGKSTLIGMITRNARVDATVIALVGERGREVGEFIDECLGPEGLARAIVVVATSDESAGRRWMAPQLATSIAERLRDSGLNVLLVIDSLTRSARAIRDLGLSAGELPVRQGYTAAVYTQLPKLLERAGKTQAGSITGLYTLLSSSENEHDALSEEVRSLLDGHLILDSAMARFGIRPAIDPLQSLSRLSGRFIASELRTDIDCILSAFKRLRNDRDIVLLGGTPDPELKAALELEPQIASAFSQGTQECIDSAVSQNIIRTLAEALRSRRRLHTSSK